MPNARIITVQSSRINQRLRITVYGVVNVFLWLHACALFCAICKTYHSFIYEIHLYLYCFSDVSNSIHSLNSLTNRTEYKNNSFSQNTSNVEIMTT